MTDILKRRGKRGGSVIGIMPLAGVLGIAIGYSVVVGWVLRYSAGAITGSVLQSDAQTYFNTLATDFGSIPWHIVAIALTALILILGVSGGIEKISKFMMPTFFILFVIIAARVFFLPGSAEGYAYLLKPDWSYLANPKTWIYAMGQAFFSLSINGAGMLIYGSYMRRDEDIIKHAGYTAVLDTIAALLAGFAIIPAVFAFGIDPTSGPSLMFVTLPQVFQQMPAGRLFAILFFISVFFAGITSLVNMMEACSEALSDRLHFSRTTAVVTISVIIFRRIGLPGGAAQDGHLAGCGHHLHLPLRRGALCGVHLLCPGCQAFDGGTEPGPPEAPGPFLPGHRLLLCADLRGGGHLRHRPGRHRLTKNENSDPLFGQIFGIEP